MNKTHGKQLLRSNRTISSVDRSEIMISGTKRANMSLDAFNLHWLWKETSAKLEVFLRRAREGKDLQAASEFARWVQTSGLIKLFSDNPAEVPHTVSGKETERLLKEVIYECGEQWNKRRCEAQIAVSELEAINHKLDLIAGQLVEMDTKAGVLVAPPLRVLESGAA